MRLQFIDKIKIVYRRAKTERAKEYIENHKFISEKYTFGIVANSASR